MTGAARPVRTGGTMPIGGTSDRVRVLVRTPTRMRVRLIDDPFNPSDYEVSAYDGKQSPTRPEVRA